MRSAGYGEDVSAGKSLDMGLNVFETTGMLVCGASMSWGALFAKLYVLVTALPCPSVPKRDVVTATVFIAWAGVAPRH